MLKAPSFSKAYYRLFYTMLALAAACPSLSAQDSGDKPKPADSPAAAATTTASPTATPPITAEQREQLKTAYEKAVKDPKVIAEQGKMKDMWDSYRTLVQKKVLADDPSMKPVFAKVDQALEASQLGQPADPLSAEDKIKLQAAFQKVSTDPEIKEAKAKMDEETKVKNALIRAAILQIDPSLESVVEAIDKSRAQTPPAHP